MFYRPALILPLLLVCSFVHSALQPLSFTPAQVQTTLEMLEKLGNKHYANIPVDDALSQELLGNYLDLLDGSRIYFLASDIAGFQKWSLTLDDALRQGDLSPGFEIFNVYRQRVVDRLQKSIDLLESGADFDFTVDETLSFDDKDLAWANSPAELDELWRKRVKDSYLRLLLAEKDAAEIPETLAKRYRNQLKRMKQTDAQDVHQYYMNALTALYDPHTNYYSPRQLENFNISMSLKLEGIGAVLEMKDETTSVVRVIPGGPADQQGLLSPQDKVVGVGQGDEPVEDVIGWRLEDVVDLIRGPKGSTVRLEIIPAKGEGAGTNKVISIVRDEVKLEEQAAKSRIIELDNNGQPVKVGVIGLPAFYIDFDAFNNRDPNYKSTTRDVARLVEELKAAGVDGIILDLRNNGGGSLHEVTTMTDLFINPGPVVQIRKANQMISRGYRSRAAPIYDGPLLVLINRLSASASEIFAGAIQDYGRGLVVGTQSYGKGTVQALVPLHEGQVKLTESKFYRVSGDSTQHRGVVPDISLASIFNLEDIGESSQDHALPWDQIHQVPVTRHNDLSQSVPTLIARHQSRAAKDADYTLLVKELEINEQRRQEKAVSLNLERRKEQQQRHEQALFDLENQRRLAKGQQPYPTISAWKDGEDLNEPDEDEIVEESSDKEVPLADDPLLKEASMILADHILLSGASPHQVVDKSQE